MSRGAFKHAQILTGCSRVPFTREDDQHLAEYLAAVIPDEGEGGRGGIEVYRRLVEAGTQVSLPPASSAFFMHGTG